MSVSSLLEAAVPAGRAGSLKRGAARREGAAT